LEPLAGAPLRTEFGDFTLIAYDSVVDAVPHVALTLGGVGAIDGKGDPIETDEPTLVRVHRRDLLGDIFGALDAAEGSTSETLRASMRMRQREGRGALVYLRPEGPVDDAANDAPLSRRLQRIRRGAYDPDSADLAHPGSPAGALPVHEREYGVGSQILRDLGLRRLRSEEHTSELQSRENLVCRLLLEKK